MLHSHSLHTYKYHSSPCISHHFHSDIHFSIYLLLFLSLSTTPMMKMALSLSLLISLFLLHTVNAHDITQILSQQPEFSTFNGYLTLTNLAAQINSRNPITVLVVDNGNLAALSAKPVDQIKNILSVHVVLDYYDAAKLQTLSATSALATTLFQTTGFALGQQGFLNVTHLGTTSTIAFASAMPGSPPGSTLVKTVYSLPYNLSILQVSTAIIPQGIDGTKTSSPPSKAPSATPATTSLPPSSVITPPSNASSPPVAPVATPTPRAAAVPSTAPPTAAKAPVPAAVPSTAPPTAAKAPIPATASPKASTAPIPSTAAPMASKAPVPSTAPPMAQGPAIAVTPSASPASSPTANAPGSASAPGVESPTSETPEEATPAEAKPKGKSAGQTLNVGLAVVFTMVLSTLCLTSSTI